MNANVIPSIDEAVDDILLQDYVEHNIRFHMLMFGGMVSAARASVRCEVNQLDRRIWVTGIAGTFLGDADLNKEVAFADFLSLANNFGDVGGWAKGDFDGSGTVLFPDFLLLSANFGKSATAVAVVPEPNATTLLLTSGTTCSIFISPLPAHSARIFRRRRR